MKKIGVIIILASYIILSLACASSGKVTNNTTTKNITSTTETKQDEKPKQKIVFDIDYEYENDMPAVSVTVYPYMNGPSIYTSFACHFKNNTQNIAKIVWSGSSFYYNGQSYLPFIEGQKYSDAKDNPMPATVIPRNESIRKEVWSSEQAYYSSGKYGGWSTLPIWTKSVTIIFQIDSGNKTEYVTANISYHLEDIATEE